MSMFPEGTLASRFPSDAPPRDERGHWYDAIAADKARINVSHALALIELEDASKALAMAMGPGVAELARTASQEIAIVTGSPELGSTAVLDDAAAYWRIVFAKLDEAAAALRCIERGRVRMEVVE